MRVDDDPELLIVLVHGTWGRGIFPALASRFPKKRWFQVGSPFRQQLQRGLTAAGKRRVEFSELLWSGSNSFVQRKEAATSLSSRLITLAEKYPNTEFAIISHSHGGNIMLSALTELPAEFRRMRLVSLATPYLSARSFQQDAPQVKRLNSIRVVIYAYFLVSFRQFFITGIGDTNSLVLHGLIAFWVYGLVRGFREKPLRIETVSTISHADLLVLRAVDDEAGLALSVGNFLYLLSSIGILALHMVSKGAFWIAIALFVGFVVFVTGEITGVLPSIDFALESLSLAILSVFFLLEICIPLMLVLLVITAIGRSINGREFFFGGALHEVNLQSVPDVSGCSVNVETLPPSNAAFGLRHSLYQHPLCIERIVKWLARV